MQAGLAPLRPSTTAQPRSGDSSSTPSNTWEARRRKPRGRGGRHRGLRAGNPVVGAIRLRKSLTRGYPGEVKRAFPEVPVVAEPHLSTREVAVMIGRHQSTATDYVNRGHFPNAYLDTSVGGQSALRVPKSDVFRDLNSPGPSLDALVRQAAQAWLAVRTNDGQDAIHYLDLEDFEYEGTRFPLKSRQRGIWKPRLLDAALSITTTFRRPGQARPYEDAVGLDGMLRYKWQGDDGAAADNRALRRAKDEGLPLIWFFGVAPGLYQPIFPVFLVDEEVSEQQFVVDIDPHKGVSRRRH